MKLVNVYALRKEIAESGAQLSGCYSAGIARYMDRMLAHVLAEVDTAPTVDAVPVVRCRNCRWWDKEREQCGITPSSSPYGHCHDGETLEHSQIKDAGR